MRKLVGLEVSKRFWVRGVGLRLGLSVKGRGKGLGF